MAYEKGHSRDVKKKKCNVLLYNPLDLAVHIKTL